MEINQITHEILDSAYKVHSALGPGLLESAYRACLVYELKTRLLLSLKLWKLLLKCIQRKCLLISVYQVTM